MHTPLYSFIPVTDYICFTFTIEDKAINIWVSTMSQYYVLHSLNIIHFNLPTQFYEVGIIYIWLEGTERVKLTCPSKSL